MHTKAFQNAIAAGVRYICLTGMDVEMLVNTVTKVNYDLMIELGEHFKEILGKANKIEVKSKNGTDSHTERVSDYVGWTDKLVSG